MNDGYKGLNKEQTALLCFIAIHGLEEEDGMLKRLDRFNISFRARSAMWVFFNEMVQRYGLAETAYDYKQGLEFDYGSVKDAVVHLLGEEK